MIKELRKRAKEEKIFCCLMDCKKALNASDNDMGKALQYLKDNQGVKNV